MKFIVERAALLPTLERTARASNHKSTLHALALVHLDTRGGNLRVAATDLQISSTTTLGAVVLEPGFWGVDAKGLLERVKNMPDTALTFTAQPKPSTALRITAPHTTRAYTVHALPGDDLPSIFETPKKNPRATYAASELGHRLRQCIPAMADEESRPHLHCVWIDLGDRPCVYATDGKRLHRAGPPMPSAEALHVPRVAAIQLAKMCAELEGEDEDESVKIEIRQSSTMLHFTAGTVTLGVKRVEAQRVQFEQIIPRECATNIRVNRATFLAAVKSNRVVSDRVSLEIVRENRASSVCYLRSVGGADEGDSVDSVECELEGDATSKPVHLFCDNLTDAFGVLPTTLGDATLGLGSEFDPAVVTAPGFLAVLMPTRA